MQTGLFGKFKLGADTIGCGDQHRVGETGRFQVKQPAESAKIRLCTGTPCTFGMRGNITNQRVTSVNIDTSIAIF